MDIKPETDTMLKLSRWMKLLNIKVWWNQKNEFDYPVFKTTAGNRKRSDLLIYSNKKYFVIECKSAIHKKNIYDAFFQLLGYSESKTTYLIDNVPCDISGGYLLATENSFNGHLFEFKYEVLMTECDFGISRLEGIKKGEIPKTEYSMTEAITRLLWRGIEEYKIECPVGVLLSNKLNNTNSVLPLALLKQGKQQYMEVLE